MCGIVGLFLKNAALRPDLGRLLARMLVEMGDRGPDSAGFAVYRRPAPEGSVKMTLFHPDPAHDWAGLAAGFALALECSASAERRGSHAVLTASVEEAPARAWIAARHAEVRVMGFGRRIEVFKDMGGPEEVARRFDLAGMDGTHALGHTRMATESAVTTEHSHPFAVGSELCLVHNGSLSNHNRLRRNLARAGIRFDTDNDSEVAAGYFAHRLQQGDSLADAMRAGLDDLDGFYTFAVGTRDGFAVLRDPVACKPAILAETDDWVAMGSEWKAIAPLPGAAGARVWEPEPATVYAWGAA
ncbi:N-methylglutamate synthase subunit A [Stella humosa]|uniref:N-methylglutamate synthase subunit A n=1 Tax=Stella humosa TaxID=94 RepID=A0A3N1L891_9PROT|nr:glutamine amidotransferase family protein [Stella humosa]ROP90893.1 N-methylglutamate synthase subunit A [Stella humosa]BBK34758.1 glutamine amidotransferase [Stella humosa]